MKKKEKRGVPMVKGCGRRREHPNNTSEGFTWPSVTTGVAQLPIAHSHTQGTPKRSSDLRSHPVAMVLLYYYYEKNAGKTGHAQNILQDKASSGPSRDWRHFWWKGPTRADIAQLPVARAHNILPDRAPVTWLTWLPVMIHRKW